MGRILLIAIRNLTEHRRRTLLLGGAIALVTILLVFMVGLSGGVQTTILRSATTLSTGHVNVAGFYKTDPQTARPAITEVRELSEAVRSAVPELAFMVPRVRGGFDRVISNTSSLQNAIIGVDIGVEKNLSEVLDVVQGRIEDMAEPGTALLFERQAEDLGVKVGDSLVVTGRTARGARNTVDVRVAAIVADMGLLSSFSTYIDAATVRELYRLGDDTSGALLLYLNDRRDADDVAVRLRGALEDIGYTLMAPEAKPFWAKQSNVQREDWTGQQIDVTTWQDEVANLTPIIDGLDLFSGVLVGVLLLIIVAGIMNTLWMAIRERTGEIGTLRAIGMSARRVRLMIVMEAALLSFFATTLGVILGVIAVKVVNTAELFIPNKAAQIFLMNDVLVLDVDLMRIVTSAVVIVVVTSLFALLPAHRAARISPAVAMQHAG